jgi:magnesium transporter
VGQGTPERATLRTGTRVEPSRPHSDDGSCVIVDSAQYVDGVRQDDQPFDLDEARTHAREGKGFVWLVVRDPATEELDEVASCFGLPPLAVEDAHEGHQRPKLEQYGDDLFWVVKTARYDRARNEVDVPELDIFIGPQHAIVVSRHTETALEGARERLDTHPELAREGPMAAAWAALDEVIDAYEPVIDALADDLEATEQAVFEGALDQSQRIYVQRRQATRLLRALHPLLGIFDELERAEPPSVPKHLQAQYRDVDDHVRRVHEEAVLLGEALDGLLNVNLSGVTVRQNRVVQKVSGWAAIAAVPTIMTGIYGMNFRHMPELAWEVGYPIVLVLMIAVVVGLRWYFKTVGWF